MHSELTSKIDLLLFNVAYLLLKALFPLNLLALKVYLRLPNQVKLLFRYRELIVIGLENELLYNTTELDYLDSTLTLI